MAANALSDYGPTLLVPAAWTLTIIAHVTSLVTRQVLLIALIVMSVILIVFLAGAWTELSQGALRPWRRVLGGGFLITVVGVGDLLVTSGVTPLLAVTLYGWMIIPAVGLVRTAPLVDHTPGRYRVFAGVAGLGAVVYPLSVFLEVGTPGLVAGLALAGLGQTGGVVNAAYHNPGLD